MHTLNTKNNFWRLKKYGLLYCLIILPIVYLVLFKYVPMYGIVLAFRQHYPGRAIFGEHWVGLKYFKMFLTDNTFWKVFKNTLLLSIFNLIISFPIPIIFALMLNEIKSKNSKKFIQTVSYLPRFFSTVVVVGIIKSLLSPSTGIVNEVIQFFTGDKILFLSEPGWFRTIYIFSDVWQFMGWNAILYIAALSGIDNQQYEAAMIDGANRWKQTIHITIPGIMPTIIICFTLAVGNMLMIGFEKVLLLYSPIIYSTADILQTFVFRMGIDQGHFSYSTAVGLFQSLISLVLLWTTNWFARKYTDYSLW